MLSGCTPAPQSPAVQLTVNGCPKVTRCRLETSAPRTNDDLRAALDEAGAAWAVCADKVDVIVDCQEKNSDQTAVITPRVE
ncbi:Rz1-like lysis system protein LysC [Trabulsiella odontotermitis]|uniref:Rz1-like lysis system protein LysC n=1 Tax=Trabulsiella odontotermitis TaxID=379893 RepID=UPI003AD0316E